MNLDNLVVAIVLNYNSSCDSKKCISYLQKQNYNNLKIVVVDNCSRNEELEEIVRITQSANVELIANKENKGYSAGNNIGFRYAAQIGAKWCLVINPDVELRDENYIDKIISIARKYKKVACVGSNIQLPSGDRQNPMRNRTFAEEFFWPIEIIKHHTKRWDHYLGSNVTGYCDILHGSCFMISVDFLKSIGYLDENVFLYCEEEILASEVRESGWHNLYFTGTTAYHEHYSKLKGSTKKRMFKYFQSRRYYFKHYSNFNNIEILLLNFSLWTWEKYWKIKGK